MPQKQEHVHTFGDWVDFTGGDSIPCQERLYYHICLEDNCGAIKWRQGSEDDHDLIDGYVSTYVDNANHYHVCTTCGVYRDAEEHDFNDQAICTICDYELPYTEGLEIVNSSTAAYVKGLGSCTDINIRIPNTYKDLPIEGIREKCFKNAQIKNVFISSNVSQIESNAFYESSINKVVFEKNTKLEYIGSETFRYCTQLTSIEIPATVTKIGNSAFVDTAIKTIKIPSGVTEIEDYLFSGCTNLENVELPEGILSIGRYAFDNCSSLSSLKIPNSVERVEYDAFLHTDFLQYNIQDGIKYLGNDTNKYLYLSDVVDEFDKTRKTITISSECKIIGVGAFYYCIYMEEIILPEGLKTIEEAAFSYCTSLVKIDIPDTVNYLGHAVFDKCYLLSDVKLSNGITELNPALFRECYALADITLPSSINTISSQAFGECTALTTIYLNESIIDIDPVAFAGCTGLENYTISSNNENYKTIDGNLYSKDGKILISYAPGKKNTAFEIPSSTTQIGEFAFSNNKVLKTITINKKTPHRSVCV